jgi:hypothetical protein
MLLVFQGCYNARAAVEPAHSPTPAQANLFAVNQKLFGFYTTSARLGFLMVIGLLVTITSELFGTDIRATVATTYWCDLQKILQDFHNNIPLCKPLFLLF